jgi:hypothetical protein
MTILLILLYPIAIQATRGGIFYILLPITIVAWVIDIVANYTELALLTWDFPREREYTFSDRCLRLIHQNNWAGFVGRCTQTYCNFFMKDHIK